MKCFIYLKLFVAGVLFDILYDASPKELLQQLNGLLLSNIRAKVWILLEVAVQEVYGLRGAEAVLVGAHVLLVALQRHVGPETSVVNPDSVRSGTFSWIRNGSGNIVIGTVPNLATTKNISNFMPVNSVPYSLSVKK